MIPWIKSKVLSMLQKTSCRSGLYLPSLGILFVTLYPPGKANCCEVHDTIMSSLHLDYPFSVWQMPVSSRLSVNQTTFPLWSLPCFSYIKLSSPSSVPKVPVTLPLQCLSNCCVSLYWTGSLLGAETRGFFFIEKWMVQIFLNKVFRDFCKSLHFFLSYLG